MDSPTLRIAGLVASLLLALASPATAGDLEIFEASVGPGGTRMIATPANDVLLDIDYGPSSAEGGRLFGLSELRIYATGDLAFTTAGFSCNIVACLHYPLPFVAGTSLIVTGGEDLLGELSTTLDLLRISVSGSNGNVVAVGGAYVDSTGPAGTPGQVQAIDTQILARVPEPGFGIGSLVGVLGLLALHGRRSGVRLGAERGSLMLAR